MATSQNGWSTISATQLDKTTFSVPGVRKGDVSVVLKYVEREFGKRVQKLYNPGCWGWAPPKAIPGSNIISNHGSGTAIDLNAPSFPWKLNRMTAKQQAECRKIVKELDGAVRWGGDYGAGNLDQMHFEINANATKVKQVAAKINGNKENKEVLELQPPVFNARYYLNSNPDVNKKYNMVNAKDHWLKNGIKEGRNSAPNFHVKEYLANYGDLQRIYGKTGYAKAVKHYFNHGINEGRSGRTIQPSQDSKFKILAEKVKALVPFTK